MDQLPPLMVSFVCCSVSVRDRLGDGCFPTERELAKPLPRACSKAQGGGGFVRWVRLVILLVFDFCDNSMREKDWRYRKRGMQAT